MHLTPSKRGGAPARTLRDRQAIREQFRSLLEESRVIPSVHALEDLPAAFESPSKLVFLLYGAPLTVPTLASQVISAHKLPVANLDFFTGFARDNSAIEFLAAAGMVGVISTHKDALRAARANGMLAIQRTFALDSTALANSIRALEDFTPDVIELIPAVAAPYGISLVRSMRPELPVIGCGLVRSLRQIHRLVRQGILSVSTSDPSLWVV